MAAHDTEQVGFSNEDEEKQISEDRHNTSAQSEPDVYHEPKEAHPPPAMLMSNSSYSHSASHHTHHHTQPPEMPPPPAFSVPTLPAHSAQHPHAQPRHPMLTQHISMGFPEPYVLRAAKIFKVRPYTRTVHMHTHTTSDTSNHSSENRKTSEQRPIAQKCSQRSSFDFKPRTTRRSQHPPLSPRSCKAAPTWRHTRNHRASRPRGP